jgi:hypothetical protein
MSDARREPIRHFDDGSRQDVTEIFAWVVEDARGGEGIPAAMIGGRIMPLIGADRARIESLREHAIAARIMTAQPVRLVRFSNREIVETLK